ncbi:hypothetical protein B566_EDAN009462, partial [Ephemera danica]
MSHGNSDKKMIMNPCLFGDCNHFQMPCCIGKFFGQYFDHDTMNCIFRKKGIFIINRIYSLGSSRIFSDIRRTTANTANCFYCQSIDVVYIEEFSA